MSKFFCQGMFLREQKRIKHASVNNDFVNIILKNNVILIKTHETSNKNHHETKHQPISLQPDAQ